MADNHLLPCPFCGAQPKVTRDSGDERVGYADTVKVQCPGCGASHSARGDTSKGGYADNSTIEKRAIAKWNRRAISAPTGAERQSIGDDAEFQDLAGDVYRAGSYNESMEKSLNALIAHIDTWGGAAPAAGNTAQPKEE